MLAVFWSGVVSAPVLAAPSSSSGPLPLEHCVTLTELGAAPVTADDVTRDQTIQRLHFAFPAAATQGRPDWFLLRLHVKIEVLAGAQGSALVIADTNGMTGARVDYRLSPTGIRAELVSLTAPAHEEQTPGRTAESSLENYLQNDGVRGGAAELAFRVELEGGAKLSRVEVFPDTCLLRTRLTPETMAVSMSVPSVVHPGDRFTVRVRLSNTGTRPIGGLSVSADPDPGVEAKSPRSRATTVMTGQWSAAFDYVATRAGRPTITIRVGTAIQPTFAVERVAVDIRTDPVWYPPGWLVAAAALILVAGIGWWVFKPVASE